MKAIKHYFDDTSGCKTWQSQLMREEYPSLSAAKDAALQEKAPLNYRLVAVESADTDGKREILMAGEERLEIPDPRPGIKMLLDALAAKTA